MIAGEDPLVGERVGPPRHFAELADRVQQHHSVGLQQLAALGEEFVIMLRADMLEHADRDDAVEPLVEQAIVLELELHMVRHAGRRRPLARDLQLVLGQGDAEHVDAGDLVQVQRHPAPAAADVEHPLPRLERELGGDMRLLVELRLLEVSCSGSVK